MRMCVLCSDWNPQGDLQAIARCHRLGQQKEVKVYRLLTRQTAETSMFQVASKKLGLTNILLNGLHSKVLTRDVVHTPHQHTCLTLSAYHLISPLSPSAYHALLCVPNTAAAAVSLPIPVPVPAQVSNKEERNIDEILRQGATELFGLDDEVRDYACDSV